MTVETEWKVGALCSQSYGDLRWGPVVAVEKVYKSGRVIIRGDQYTPIGDLARRSGGRNGWGYAIPYVLMTPENAARRAADLEKLARIKRAHKAADVLQVFARKRPTDIPEALLTAVEEFAAQMDEEPTP